MDIKKKSNLLLFSRIGNTKQGILIMQQSIGRKGGSKLETVTWKVFASTGKVEDYLYYKGENSSLTTDKKKDAYFLKQTSEEAVWEEPLR